jgi:hypothetical protein
MNELTIRRLGMLASLIGAALIFAAGLMTRGSGNNVVGYLGIALAVVGGAIALLVQLRIGALGWVGLLGASVLWLIVAGIFNIAPPPRGGPNLVLMFMPLALIGVNANISEARSLVHRGVIASLGLTALLTIILSGALAGGGGAGTVLDPGVQAMSTQLYGVAGALALVLWVAAILEAIRTTAWGWLVVVIVFFGIGGMMYGLFGPSIQDLDQTRAQAAAKKMAGVRN